jgi:small subunit ribosomal protein S3
MGQKVSPIGLRIGVNKDWESKWFASNKDFSKYLNNDIKIRKFLAKELKEAAVASIIIERNNKRCDVTIKSAKPGVIIGKGGEDIEKLRNKLKKLVNEDIYISIVEVKNPDLNAQIVAQNIALQIEARAPFRSVQKRAIRNAMKSGAKGIKTLVSGRVGGAEMARGEGYTEGTVPLHTVRADIDYGTAEALTTYGIIGVKVWIYKGEILPSKKNDAIEVNEPSHDKLHFGDYGLMANEGAYISAKQIEAARIAMTRYMKRGGKVYINIFPHLALTKKPLETRQGTGKGNVDEWVAVVKKGKIMFEISDVSEEIAREALRLASHKLPVTCKFVKKEGISNEG